MLNVTEPLLRGDDAAATSFLREIAAEPDVPAPFLPFIRALQSIVAGSLDRTLADNPDFDYEMGAETLLLIEMLETRSQQQ